MLNQTRDRVARMGTAFVIAAAATGCATVQRQNFNPEVCKISTSTTAEALLLFRANYNSEEAFSKACSEGKTAATTTLIGRNEKGELSIGGALFGLEYDGLLKEKISGSPEEEKPFWQDVKKYFDYYLTKLGNINVGDVQKYVDGLLEQAEQQKPKDAPSPSFPKHCTGSGTLRLCK